MPGIMDFYKDLGAMADEARPETEVRTARPGWDWNGNRIFIADSEGQSDEPREDADSQ
jgi:hypothetical protein